MLTTLRTALPVAPFQWPTRTRSANTDIRFSTSCTSATTSAPPTSMRDPTGATQCNVQNRAVLGRVDRVAGEHRIDPLAQAAFLRELDEQPERLVGDPVLGVVEIDVLGFDGEALATVAVRREQVAQVEAADLVGMPGK